MTSWLLPQSSCVLCSLLLEYSSFQISLLLIHTLQSAFCSHAAFLVISLSLFFKEVYLFIFKVFSAPNMGLGLMTLRSRVGSSTDWARDLLVMPFLATILFKCLKPLSFPYSLCPYLGWLFSITLTIWHTIYCLVYCLSPPSRLYVPWGHESVLPCSLPLTLLCQRSSWKKVGPQIIFSASVNEWTNGTGP